MATPALILFDDLRAQSWEPFALTRPAGELLFGSLKLVERAERATGLRCAGYLTSEHLIDFKEAGAPPVLEHDHLPRDRDLLFWCSRAAVDPPQTLALPAQPTVYTLDGVPVARFAPAGVPIDPDALFRLELGAGAAAETRVEGRLLEWVWDLMSDTPDQLGRDLAALPAARANLPPGVYLQGDHPLSLAADVGLEPGVLFDTRDGPIQIGARVEVRAGTRLAGPAAIGPNSRLLGGSFEKISTGPYSYLRGELADSVVLGYANKAHDGHMGHAYLGRWVNLGAMTTNSDLKNNYSSVRVWTPGGVQDTGKIKIGCFLGDHVKTGIGLLLSTGSVVGAGSNLFGSAMPPTYVQPFSWGSGSQLVEYKLTQFLQTAAAAMARRGVELDDQGRRYLETCWRRGRAA